MISISEDRNTAGIVKVTLFADTYEEMMEECKVFPTRYYNGYIQKNTLRFGPNHNGHKQWIVHASYWTNCE